MLDHIVYAVHDLESAIEHFADTLGIAPTFGGYHSTKGTKNALLDLGGQAYLELLAIDETNKIPPPRWMGIDLIISPKITRWAVKSNQLEHDAARLKDIHPLLGEIEQGQRMTGKNELLQWQLTQPLPTPEVELLPFLISWEKQAIHPTAILDKGCSLQSFYGTHPKPEGLLKSFEQLGLHLELHQAKTIGLHATIEGPKGSISL